MTEHQPKTVINSALRWILIYIAAILTVVIVLLLLSTLPPPEPPPPGDDSFYDAIPTDYDMTATSAANNTATALASATPN